MSISTEKDPLDSLMVPERVFYSLGALLDMKDFEDEQTYHRGRLARALSLLGGHGTVSGLEVEYEKPPDDQIVVHPGVAIDRLGRIIEVPRDVCIRLDKWYAAQTVTDLVEAFHAANGGVVIDVFLLFVSCDRALTPAFATGPFDATDYTSPSRTRDAYQLSLVLRKENPLNYPEDRWPDFASIADLGARRTVLHRAIFDSSKSKALERDSNGRLVPLKEHAPGQDPASLFLAQIVIPAAAGSPPTRGPGDIAVDNEKRLFVYPIGALARWIGL